MKLLAALLVAVAFFVPTLAQDVKTQETRTKPAVTAPAAMPMILYTGKPLTADEKLNLAKENMEFAYAFVSGNSGQSLIRVSSPNAGWVFLQCEIRSTPLN
jgi:Holliday junction resolvase